MNKLLVVLLAVCLVTVHAFVKREAESPKEENFLDSALKSIQESAKEASAKMSSALNPENIQKGFSDAIDSLTKALNKLKNEDPKPQ